MWEKMSLSGAGFQFANLRYDQFYLTSMGRRGTFVRLECMRGFRRSANKFRFCTTKVKAEIKGI